MDAQNSESTTDDEQSSETPDTSAPESPNIQIKKSKFSLPLQSKSKRDTKSPNNSNEGSNSSGTIHVASESSDILALNCPMCPYTSTKELDLQRHVNVEHLDDFSPAKPSFVSSVNNNSNYVNMPLNDYSFKKPLLPHEGVSGSSANVNSMSSMEPGSQISISDSAAEQSNNTIKHDCPVCGVVMPSIHTLEQHISTKHGATCLSNDAGPSSSSSSSAMQHVCPMCGKRFVKLDVMTAHVNCHFPEDDQLDAAQNVKNTVSPRIKLDEELAASLVESERQCHDEAMARDLAQSEQRTADFSDPGSNNDQETSDEQLALEISKREEANWESEQREFEKLKKQYGMDDKNNYQKQCERSLEFAVSRGHITMAEMYDQKRRLLSAQKDGIEDGFTSTTDIIPAILEFYNIAKQYNLKQAWTCNAVNHFAGSYGDRGWGCGYRNLQMLLSSMATCPIYREVVFNGRPLMPSIPKIQQIIEAAWSKGFDEAGARQLGGKLVNTSKWIGSTEIATMLLSLKVKCELIDFHSPSGPNNAHPKMMNWVKGYFQCDTAFKAPLYLQHQGHSRTIIGIEELKDGNLRLLIIDPSCSNKHMNKFTYSITGALMKTLRRGINTLRAKQYQIVAVSGVIPECDYDKYKTLKSVRIS